MSRSSLEFFVSLVSAATVERIGWLLVHSLWQFVTIALVALFLDLVLKRRTAALRYAMLLVGLLMMVTTPFVTWVMLPDSLDISDQPDVSIVAAASTELTRDVAMMNGTSPTLTPPTVGKIETSAIMTAEATLRVETWLDRLATILNPWLATIVGIWCCGVLLFSLRPFVSWVNVHQLTTRGVSPVSIAVQDAFDRVQQRLKIVRRVQVLQSIVVNSPIVVGCFRSTILLPASFISGVPVSQLEAILAHELAHVRRYDYLVNLLQTLVETLFFYHPAVWWISHRIRDERENCCDDLVVAALGNRIEYGRALLAVEQFRSAATSSLVLSAKGGSLLTRVKRLFADPLQDNRSSSGLAAIGILLALITAAGVWTTVIAVADENSKDDESKQDIAFGPESHGLQFRVVALSPDVNDDAPDLKAARNEWTESNDMTFGVELKNVSHEPLTLAGVRYGENFATETQGKPGAARYAPYWFSFEFTDLNGKPIPRTHREFYQGWSIFDSSSTHKLTSGQSLIEVLRPAEFYAPMDFDLPPGKYKARVRYHGPDNELRENVRKHWPDKAILNAWPHDVVSNSVEFEVKQPSRRTRAEDLVWGQPVDGMQAAIEYRIPDEVTGNPLIAPGVPVGTPIGVMFHVRNVSDKPITFVSETGRQGDFVNVVNERGNKVEVRDRWQSGRSIDVAWKLEPGEMAQLLVLTPKLESLYQPGRYTVRYTIRFNNRGMKDDAGNIIFRRPGDYNKQVDTGDTPLFLAAAMNSAAVDGAVAPK
jgi:beta-lactamase regulating signal transducer with metallopeptidase domain